MGTYFSAALCSHVFAGIPLTFQTAAVTSLVVWLLTVAVEIFTVPPNTKPSQTRTRRPARLLEREKHRLVVWTFLCVSIPYHNQIVIRYTPPDVQTRPQRTWRLLFVSPNNTTTQSLLPNKVPRPTLPDNWFAKSSVHIVNGCGYTYSSTKNPFWKQDCNERKTCNTHIRLQLDSNPCKHRLAHPAVRFAERYR
jgi:hypothetical protein